MDIRPLRQVAADVGARLHGAPKPGARMRPGYLVVGTKRGGSTSLASWISRHPEVAPCRRAKGTHYFDTNFKRGRNWYAHQFEPPAARWRITGEASPYYMFHPLSVARIADELPHVKLIAVLRNPVDRAWSQYRYEVERGREHEDFLRAVQLEDSRIAGERERLVSDPRYAGWEYRHHAYLARGRYAEQLTEIYRHFPAQKVLVVKSEEMFARPAAIMDQVWSFLGLPAVSMVDSSPQNAGPERAEMTGEAAEWLENYYTPLNAALYEQPGVNFRWKASS